MSYFASTIVSVQSGSITIGNGGYGAAQALPNPVNPASSVLRFLGASQSNGGSGDSFALLTFTSTTVTATRSTNTGNLIVKFQVIEYRARFIRSIQAGTITLAGVTSNTATVSAVDTTKAELIWLGCRTSDNVSGNGQNWWVNITLTNATTITATMGAALATAIVSYLLVEFK